MDGSREHAATEYRERTRSELEPGHAEIIRATLPLVGAHIDEITSVFYRSLFDAHPALLRDLFNRANQNQGWQARALAASVARFAAALIDPDGPDPAAMLSRVSHKHASLGVTADQYQVVHQHLFAAIVAVLGADVVTAPIADAWDRVYWSMANALIDRETELYARVDVAPGAVLREAVLVARHDDPPGVAVLTLASTDPVRPFPAFAPGQYISVRAPLSDGARQFRQYSLVGAAGDGQLTIAVKRVDAEAGRPAGEVSMWLHERLAVGDTVTVSLPFGDVVPAPAGPLVLISAGIGIAPMIGILEELAARTPDRPVQLTHADRSPATHPLRARLLELTAALPALTVRTWYTESDDGTDRGRFDPGAIDVSDAAGYILCGPAEFLSSVRNTLRLAGIPDDRVRSEQFTPMDWSTATASGTDSTRYEDRA